MDTLPAKPISTNGSSRRTDRNYRRKRSRHGKKSHSEENEPEEESYKSRPRDRHRHGHTPQSSRRESRHRNGAASPISRARSPQCEATSRTTHHSREVDEQMVIKWLRSTPDASTSRCIRHFERYLPDENARNKFTALIKNITILDGRKLCLREEYREGSSRRRERKRSISPLQNGVNGEAREHKVSASTLELGEDFIPLPMSPPSSPSEKDFRRRERRRDGDGGREWDIGEDIREAQRRRDRDQRRKDRERSLSRSRDKGKERAHGSNQNGKHEMVFDFRDGYSERRVDTTSRKAPWVSDVDWESCRNVAEMYRLRLSRHSPLANILFVRLHLEVEAYVRYISPSPIEDEIRGLIVELVSRAITQAFPDAKVIPFGSYATKLYLPKGHVYHPFHLKLAA
jgi:hypothetical protein